MNQTHQPISIYDRGQNLRWSETQLQPRTSNHLSSVVNNIYVPQPQQPQSEQTGAHPTDPHHAISIRSSGHRSQTSYASVSLPQRDDTFKSPHKEQSHFPPQPFDGNKTLHAINFSNRDGIIASTTLPTQTGQTLPSYPRSPDELLSKLPGPDVAALLRKEIEDLKSASLKEKDELLRQIEDLKAKLARLGQDKTALVDKAAIEEVEVSSLKKELSCKEGLLTAERDRVKKLLSEQAELNESLAALQNQVNSKRDFDSIKTNESRGLVDSLNEENLKIKKELRDLKSTFEEQLLNLQTERNSLQQQKSRLETHLNLLNTTHSDEDKYAEKSKINIESLESTIKLLSSDHKTLKEKSSKLEQENQSLKGQIKVLLQERVENNNQAIHKSSQLQEYEREAKSNEELIRHLKQQLADKDIETLKQAQTRAGNAGQLETDQLKKEIAKLRSIRDDLQKSLEAAQLHAKEVEKKLADSMSKVKSQLEATEKIGKNYEESKVDIQKLKSRLATSDNKVKSLEDIIKDLTSNYEAKQLELEKTDSAVKEAVNLIEDKDKSITSLGLQLKIEKEKVALFDETIHQTESRLSGEIQEKDKLIALLNREVKRRQQMIEELFGSLSRILFGETEEQPEQEQIIQRIFELVDADLAVKTTHKPANILVKEPSNPQLPVDFKRVSITGPPLSPYQPVSSTFNIQDEVNPDRINELLEEIKRVQGAKDHLAGVLDDLLKKQEELSNATPALTPQDLDPQTLRIIEAYRNNKTPSGLISHEAVSPDRDNINQRLRGNKSDIPTDLDIDHLEKEFDEKVFKPITAQERIRELEAEVRRLREALEDAQRRTPQKSKPPSQRSTPPKPSKPEEDLAQLHAANTSLKQDLEKAKRDNEQFLEAIVKLKAEQKVIQSEIDLFKNSLIVKEVREELDKIRAIEEQISGEDKLAQDIPAENSELIDFLMKAAKETRSLQDKYSEAVNNLNLTLNDMDDTDNPNEEFLQEIKKEHLKADSRLEEQLRQFNHGLWDAVVTQKKVMNNLQRRIMTLERWSTDRTPGQPASDKLTEEALSVLPDKQPSEIREVEGSSVFPAKKKLKKFTPPQTVAELEDSADEDHSKREPQSPEIIPHETLVDLLITMVQLVEDLRNLTYEESRPSSDVIKQIQDRLESFEIIGENGGFDMSLIQKVIQGNRELDSNRFDDNVIKEANPEDEEDPESKRLKSSMRQSLAQSQRIKSDTNRTKDLGQKRDTFTDLIESKDRMQIELTRKHEEVDFLKQELERSKVDHAKLLSLLTAEREDNKKKSDLIQSLSIELKDKMSKSVPSSKDSKDKSGSERQVRAGLSSSLQKKFDLIVKEKDAEIIKLQLLVDALSANKKDSGLVSPKEQKPAPTRQLAFSEDIPIEDSSSHQPISRENKQDEASNTSKPNSPQNSHGSSADRHSSQEAASIQGKEKQAAVSHLESLVKLRDEEIERLKSHIETLPKPSSLANLEELLRNKDEEIKRLAAALKQVRTPDNPKQKVELTANEKSVKSALTPSLQKKFEEAIRSRDAEIQRLSHTIDALAQQQQPQTASPQGGSAPKPSPSPAHQTESTQDPQNPALPLNTPTPASKNTPTDAEADALRLELQRLQKENHLYNQRLAELENQQPHRLPHQSTADLKSISDNQNQRLLDEATNEVHRLTAMLRQKDDTIELLQRQPRPLQPNTTKDQSTSISKNPQVLRSLSDQISDEKSSKETALATAAPQKDLTNKTADFTDVAARNESLDFDDSLKQRLEATTQDLRARDEEISKLKSALAAIKTVEQGKQKPQLSAEEKSIRTALTPSLQRKLDDTIRHREADIQKLQIVIESLKNPQTEAKQAELESLRSKVQTLEKALEESNSQPKPEPKQQTTSEQTPQHTEHLPRTQDLSLIPSLTIHPSPPHFTAHQDRSEGMDFTFKSHQLKALERDREEPKGIDHTAVPLKESRNQSSEGRLEPKLKTPVAPPDAGPADAEGCPATDNRKPATARQDTALREDLRRARKGAAGRDLSTGERAGAADEHPGRPRACLDPQDGAEHEAEVAAEVVSGEQKQRHRDEPDARSDEEQQDGIS